MSSDSKAVGQRAHTTFGGDVHPRICASVPNVVRTPPGLTSVTSEEVNAGAGARADYPYSSPTTVVVKTRGDTPTTSTG